MSLVSKINLTRLKKKKTKLTRDGLILTHGWVNVPLLGEFGFIMRGGTHIKG